MPYECVLWSWSVGWYLVQELQVGDLLAREDVRGDKGAQGLRVPLAGHFIVEGQRVDNLMMTMTIMTMILMMLRMVIILTTKMQLLMIVG
jgi:hypothetical protein